MWYKNKKTGHTWLITDKDVLKHVKKLDYFEKVEDKSKDKDGKTSETVECKKCDKTFGSEKALKAHNRMVHKEDGDK